MYPHILRQRICSAVAALTVLTGVFAAPALVPTAAAQGYCPECKANKSSGKRCPIHGVRLQSTSTTKAQLATAPPSKPPATDGASPRSERTPTTGKAKRTRSTINLSASTPTQDLLAILAIADDEKTPVATAVQRIKGAVQRGANVNVRDKKGATALMWASSANQAELVRLLLTRGAQVNLANDTGVTALMFAAAGSPEITRLLLEKRANVVVRSKAGLTPLISAAAFGMADCVELLIQAGAPVNAANNSGETPLTVAVTEGYAEVVRVLLSKGANINTRFEEDKATPLILCTKSAKMERAAIARLLVNAGAGINATDAEGHTSLHYAARNDDEEMLHLLLNVRGIELNVRCTNGFTPLMEAAETGGVKATEALLTAGADVNVEDKTGKTAIDIADDNEKDEIVSLLREKMPSPFAGNKSAAAPKTPPLPTQDEDTEEYSKSKPTPGKTIASGNGSARRGSTATETLVNLLSDTDSAFANRFARISAAIEAGADVNGRNKSGQTALYQACNASDIEAVKWLLNHKADPNFTDAKGHPPLHLSAIDTDTTILALLLDAPGILVDAADSESWNALMYAIANRSVPSVRLLLEKGADPTLALPDGTTPMHLASRVSGADNDVDGAPDVMRALLDSGKVSANLASKKGNTPLMYASAYGRKRIVMLLLARGANANAKSESGITPLNMATEPPEMAKTEILKSEKLKPEDKQRLLSRLEANYKEIARLLKQAGAKE